MEGPSSLQSDRNPDATALMPLRKHEQEKDLNCYLPLYKAALKGDWESARKFFDKHPDAVTAKIAKASVTALHIAVGKDKEANIVEKLLDLIPTEALVTLQDDEGHTALHYAAIFGSVEAAKLLVSRNNGLVNTLSANFLLPLHLAAKYANKQMVSYLFSVTRDDMDPNPFADNSGAQLLNLLILAEFYDLALYLVQLYPRLAILESSDGNNALSILAGKFTAFPSRNRLGPWQRIIYSWAPVKCGEIFHKYRGEDIENQSVSSQTWAEICSSSQFSTLTFGYQRLYPMLWEIAERLVARFKHIREMKFMQQQARHLLKYLCTEITTLDYSTAASMFQQPILVASCLGINEVVEEILEAYPCAIWSINSDGHNIFLLAVLHRRESIFNLLYQMSEQKKLTLQLTDVEGNCILHLVGNLAPRHQLNPVSGSGAALLMQRELQWYREVEKHLPPDYRDKNNNFQRTPELKFSEGHKDLVKKGEQWMKDTANYCTIASTLIATLAFTAFLTLPGGSNRLNGFPISSKEIEMDYFAVSNTLSLFFSTASLLIFLSILTARYAENDFLYILPLRLIVGQVTLFCSIATMMIASNATIHLVFGDKRGSEINLSDFVLSLIIPSLFLALAPLHDMISSTFGPGIFGKNASSTKSTSKERE